MPAARYFEAARAKVAARHDHVVSVDIASRPAGLSRTAGRRLLCADRFHPGAEGYRLWAERIANACSTILEPQAASRPTHPGAGPWDTNSGPNRRWSDTSDPVRRGWRRDSSPERWIAAASRRALVRASSSGRGR